MSDDPNADLFGHTFTADDGWDYVVGGPWLEGPPGYVVCACIATGKSIIRPASVARRSKQLTEEAK